MRVLRLSSLLAVAAFALPAAAQTPIEKKAIGNPSPILTPAIMVGNTLYISGQLPPGNLADSSITVQTKATITRIKDILAQAQMDLSDVTQVTVYLTNGDDFQGMNTGYTEMFTAAMKPTRTTVVVAALVSRGAKLEITATAVKTK